MRRTIDFVLKKPVLTLVILLLITGFFTQQIMTKAKMETNLDNYMPRDHEAFILSDYYEEVFAIKDAIIVAVENEEGVLNPGTLQKIDEITRRISNLPEINPGDVRSLSTVDNIIGSDFGLEIKPFYTEVPRTKEEIAKLNSDLKQNEMVRERIISKDGTATLISAELTDKTIDRRALYQKVTAVLSGYEGPERLYVAGQPVVEGTLAHLMPTDMRKMVPLVVLVIFTVLLLTLRSLKSALLTLGVVLFSTIWAFGLMAACNIPIYSVSTMIPVMLIALGVADGVHLLSHLRQTMLTRPRLGLTETIKDMTARLWKPVVMTSVTTAVGFLSLVTSEVYPIKYFGLFTAFGVMAAMIFSLLFIPAGLKLCKLPVLPQRMAKGETVEEISFFSLLAGKVLAHKKTIVFGALLFVVLGLIGLRQIKVDSSFLSKFEKDEEIVLADEFINRHFAGTTNLNVVFESAENDGMKNPEYLKAIWRLQNELEQMAEVGDTYGINDYLRRINKVMNEDQAEFNRVPDDSDLVAQYLLLYSMSGDPQDLDKVIDYDYKRLNLQVSLRGDNAELIRKVIAKINEFTASSKLKELRVDYAGSAYTNMIFTNLILEGQVKSLFISIILVIILVGIQFASLSAGLLGSVPIMITAILNFGIMGYLGVTLNTTSALISSIAVGMGIDYSIHLLSKYQSLTGQGLPPLETAKKAMDHSGRAITFNALVVITGFLVLLCSNFPPNRELGALVSLSMFFSFLSTLAVVVALIDLLKPRFIVKKKNYAKEVQL